MSKVKKNKRVAIIGSRDLSEDQLDYLIRLAERFASLGWEISTGCADGADHAAMIGCRNVNPDLLHVFLPWASYNKDYHLPTDHTTVFNPKKHGDWADSVEEYHPNPSALKQGMFKLHARNYGIVEFADIVVAYPPSMQKVGGTGQGIRVAQGLGIPTFILCDADDRKKLERLLAGEEKHQVKSDFNITVAATQKFTDYDLFREKCLNIIGDLRHKRSIVIHAKCGANVTELAQRLCDDEGFTLRKTAHKSSAGLIAFHDMQSKVVDKQITLAKDAGQQVRVINYLDYLKSTEPTIVKGDILDFFYEDDTIDAVCVTTNGVIKRNGQLVMGAGVAKVIAEEFPNVPSILAKHVKKHGNTCCFIRVEDKFVISFPTKHDWNNNSDLDLIEQSMKDLMNGLDTHGIERVALPRPGINNGNLKWKDVLERITPYIDERVVFIAK